MAKILLFLLLQCLLLLYPVELSANDYMIIESNLFIKTGKDTSTRIQEIFISSFSDPLIIQKDLTWDEKAESSIELIRDELTRIFQIDPIEHMTSGFMLWDRKKSDLRETIFIDGTTFQIRLSPTLTSKERLNLRIEMLKQYGQGGDSVNEKLLDTELNFNINEPMVLGFPSNGTMYFLSILFTFADEERPFIRKDVNRVSSSNIIMPPVPIRTVRPIYPAKSRYKRIEGTVLADVSIDEQGKVVQVKVVKSVAPDLDFAAKLALEHWKYRPVIMRGKPVPVEFIVAVDFTARTNIPSYDGRTERQVPSELERVLSHCADYCEKLANSILHFTCLEIVNEEILGENSRTTLLDDTVLTYLGRREYGFRDYFKLRHAESHKYDYQLVRENNAIIERRSLLDENNVERNTRTDELKSLRFHHRNIIIGPVRLLSAFWQNYHTYELERSENLNGEDAYVIKILPIIGYDLGHLFGTVWVSKKDFSVFKIEWYQESIIGYEFIKDLAAKGGLRPVITITAEYAFEKNGIRFPSVLTIEEAYSSAKWKKFTKSKKNVVYKNYRFFIVETEIKY